MDQDEKRKLFMLAADGDLGALKEVVKEAIRVGVPIPGSIQVACRCEKILLLTPKSYSTCECGVRWHFGITIESKEPALSPPKFGGINEKNDTHTQKCYTCGLFFPGPLEEYPDDYHNNIYEKFCPACAREGVIKWKYESYPQFSRNPVDPFDSFP